MSHVPSYAKVLTLGTTGTERIFQGDVEIQEKVDGSTFIFGVDEEGHVACRSHNQQIDLDAPNKMFAQAVEHVKRIQEDLARAFGNWTSATWFYCEYLQKPKHNTIAYNQTPRNHLVLFDAFVRGAWVRGESLGDWADALDIDVIPTLHLGPADLERVKGLMQRESYLGGATIEGVVIKNYSEFINLGGRVFPLFCKHVNVAFKERNAENWAKESGKSKLQAFMDSFNTPARWQKAVQHLVEAGQLQGAPQDIGPLMKEVYQDIVDEEAGTIKDFLYHLYLKDIVRTAQRGFPEWYKAQLAERIDA
jgi:hypothetical protein